MARRRYQSGELFLRGKRQKVWVLRWREDILEEGRLRRVKRSRVIGTKQDYPTERLARRAAEGELSVVNSLSYRATPAATFLQFSDKWQNSVLTQMKPSTASAFRSQLKRHLLAFFGLFQMRDISAERVQEFVSCSATAPKTIKNCIALLRIMWNSAKAWGYVAHDPFESVRLPQIRRRERFFFSLEEIRRILDSASEPYKTFFWLAAETGLRAGELCGLRVEDIDRSKALVRVRQSVWRGKVQDPKSKAAFRDVAVSEELAQQLKGVLASWRQNSLRLLFATRNGTPWDANLLVKRKLRPLLNRLGIPQCGLHAFRHASATTMDQLGTPVAVRMRRLGHADAQTTMGYTHSVDADERALAKELGAALTQDAAAQQELLAVKPISDRPQ